jgi:hypothetical protein
MIARKRLRLGVAVLCLGGLAAWGLLAVFRPSLGPSITSVSAERLSQHGVVLTNPFPWDQPRIGRSKAEQIAIAQAQGGTVLQSVLAEVVMTNPSLRQPRLCWVVSFPGSLVVSNGPPGSAQSHASFYLIFIDARTGEFVQGTAGG